MALFGARAHYEVQLARLVKAYRAGRSTFDEDLSEVIALMGPDHPGSTSPDGYVLGWTLHLDARRMDAQAALKLVRFAWVSAFYHFFELQARDWTGQSKGNGVEVAEKVKESEGYDIDFDGIEVLRMANNVVKHDAPGLHEKMPSMFDPAIHLYIERGEKPPYAELLTLTDAHMEMFIATLAWTGPKPDPGESYRVRY